MQAEEIILGVPKKMVLALVLFMKMTSDLDSEAEESIVRCFASDTRVSKMIGSEDKENTQEDLDIMCKWTKVNLMEFNEKKFKQISYGTINNVKVTPFKGPRRKEIESEVNVED